ncbi:MAG TPA: chemotaxis protein CheW [Steroidobacteraceae bacterium]|nr:chemotaxis protein CheW [Steroidobacteraceae bacterium]
MHKEDSRAASAADGGGSRQVLTFSLGREVYGVDILRVKEIRGWSPVTRIPQSPGSVLGVLNLRGAIVPIIDLRVRFSLASAEFNAMTVIIVLSLRTGEGQRECGVVVDNVKDVVDIDVDNIRPVPSMSAGAASEFIQGITTIDEQMLILLNPDDLVENELSATSTAEQAA